MRRRFLVQTDAVDSSITSGRLHNCRIAFLRWTQVPWFIVSLLFASFSSAQAAESVTLAWDPGSEADIAGYRLHYGTSSSTYTDSIDVGNATSATMSSLTAGITYFCVVTAYNTAGLESVPSSEVSFTAATRSRPQRPPPPIESASNEASSSTTERSRPQRPLAPVGGPINEASTTVAAARPNQPLAVISAIRRLPDGSCQFTLTGTANPASTVNGVSIYVSSDLKTWTLLTNVANPTEPRVVTDPDAAFVDRRFYRVSAE
jgi:Fibronectin type III domain